MAVHLMSGEVWDCLHWYVCVPCVSLGVCMCVFWGHSCESVYFCAYTVCVLSPGILCVLYFSSEDILLAPWM